MKKNKSQQVDEGFLDALIGDTGAAGLKSMFKKGMTKQAQLAQDLFLKDFIGDAVASLQAGIKGGFINPTAPAPDAPAPMGASNDDSMAVKTAKSRTGTQPAGSPNPTGPAGTLTPGAKAAPVAKPAGTQYMGKVAPNAGPVTKPAVAQKPNPLSAPTLPKTTVSATPNPNAKPGGITKGGAVFKEDATYARLSALFESIMEATGGQSISDYMTGWFNKYMGGVDWQANKATLQPIIQNIQATYGKDKGYGAIKQLAQAAFAVAKTSGTTPEGAKDIEGAGGAGPGQQQGTRQGAPQGAQPGAAPKITAKDINQVIPNLSLPQLQALKKTIDAFIAAKAKPAAAPTATAESRYRR